MDTSVRETREEVFLSLQLVREKNYAQAEEVLLKGVGGEELQAEEKAVLYSTLGLVYKMQEKHDEAWGAYKRAEKELPDDPLLKIIVARFLLNDRPEYDQVIQRAKQILVMAKEIPSFSHQAYSLMGLAYLKKGNKRKAGEMLDKAMKDDFSGIASAENIDFQLVEAFLSRNLEVEKCRRYINSAANLARERREYKLLTVFQKLLDSLETTVV